MPQIKTNQRDEIYRLKQAGCTQSVIAEVIGADQSTISRELKRNKSGPSLGYLPDRAQKKAQERRSAAKTTTTRWHDHPTLLFYVIEKLQCVEHWSPEQISGRLILDYPDDEDMRVSYESIYAYIWKEKRKGGILHTCLRHRGKKKNKRGAQNAGRGMITNRRDIKDRPIEVTGKVEIGHHESDLVVGSQGTTAAIATIVERVSKKLFAHKISRRTTRCMNGAIKRALGSLPLSMRKTITHDNGKEMADHTWITKTLGIIVYFATPYHSWERGLNEHTNGLIRQYYPKTTDFRNVTQYQLDIVVEAINNRPRKILNYRTPNEVFQELLKLCV
jgi:transposase, IS30 family